MNPNPIVLVEDNPDDAELTLRALKKSKILNDVRVARDGAEALELLLPGNGEKGLKAALVLLDLKLPGMDGIEVLRRLRNDQRTRVLPVIILTTSKEQEDLINGYHNGCNSYIRKPVDFLEFVGAVQQIGLYWLMLNEAPPH
ncbi:MAG TPA: response regulator [Candidatus Angelobacter sp.]|jgi:two-component system response regulator|nr:response regulator [Candidatus Angelobacter sp.]